MDTGTLFHWQKYNNMYVMLCYVMLCYVVLCYVMSVMSVVYVMYVMYAMYVMHVMYVMHRTLILCHHHIIWFLLILGLALQADDFEEAKQPLLRQPEVLGCWMTGVVEGGIVLRGQAN